MSIRTTLVTGSSRGVGKGVATALATAGFKVFATGRSVAGANLPAAIARIPCDHTRSDDTRAAFAQISSEAGALDVLVNCAWGGYERMTENGAFTWTMPFWEQPAHRWSSMMDAGVRAAFECCCHAAKLMIPRGKGLIVNISYWAAQKHIAT